MRSSLREALARPERTPAPARRSSGTPTVVRLYRDGPIEQPVDLIDALKRFGLGLSDAHDAVDRLSAGERVELSLTVSPESGPPGGLLAFGLGLWERMSRDAAAGEAGGAPPDTVSIDMADALRRVRVERPDLASPAQTIDFIVRDWLKEHGYLVRRGESEPAG